MLVNFVKPNKRGAAYDVIETLSNNLQKRDSNKYKCNILYIDDVNILSPTQYLSLLTEISNNIIRQVPFPDIWHIYDWKFFLPFMELEKTLLWLHGISFIIPENKDIDKMADRWEVFVMCYQKYAYLKANAIIVSSNFISNALKKVFGERNNIFITGIGVNEEKFAPKERKPNTKTVKDYDIAIAAPHKPAKNIRMFIDIVKELKLIDKTFIAGQETPHQEEITEMVKNSGIKHAYINYNDMPSFYNNTKVYVQTSVVETWGLAITEAMSCGIPVVSTNVGAISEQVTNGTEGYLCNNKDQMIDRIKYLLENPDEARQMGLNGRKKVLENFTMDKYLDNILKAYDTVLSK